MTPTEKSAVLIESLPWIQRFAGSTFLVKMGGSCMESPDLVEPLMRDLIFLKAVGIKPIVVHGGGKRISAAMADAGIEAEFIGGFRVTSDEAIDLVSETLSKVVNPEIVSAINTQEGRATGIEGHNVFMADRLQATGENGELQDIGRVGQVTECVTEDVLYAVTSGIIPVVSPLGRENETGLALNINADLAAAALAKALKVRKLIYISDVPGLLQDIAQPDSLIPSITRETAKSLIDDGTIGGGMIPKITSAIDAIDQGVNKVHFIDGRMPHTLLLEIFTQTGIGTEITP